MKLKPFPLNLILSLSANWPPKDRHHLFTFTLMPELWYSRLKSDMTLMRSVFVFVVKCFENIVTLVKLFVTVIILITIRLCSSSYVRRRYSATCIHTAAATECQWCSNRSISPACWAHSSKPCAPMQLQMDRQWMDTIPFHRPCSTSYAIVFLLPRKKLYLSGFYWLLFRYFLDWLRVSDAFLWRHLRQLESRDFPIYNLLSPVSEEICQL